LTPGTAVFFAGHPSLKPSSDRPSRSGIHLSQEPITPQLDSIALSPRRTDSPKITNRESIIVGIKYWR
jgi:hypothetical protein